MEDMLLEPANSSPNDHSTTKEVIVLSPIIDGLANITDPAKSLVIWERKIPNTTTQWLSSITPEGLPRGRVLVRLDHIENAIERLFDARELSDHKAALMLAQDIIRLAHLFADIGNSDQVDIRLDVIQHNACRKFHLDNVDLRLVTTYLGESTHYVAPQYSKQALQDQEDYDGPLETIPKQSVAIFKGSRCVTGGGIVHRSPPIEGTDQTRLFLCINTPSHASPPVWRPDQC